MIHKMIVSAIIAELSWWLHAIRAFFHIVALIDRSHLMSSAM
jgi:hypothetical protein